MKLNNQEIWLAYPNLEKLAKLNFPVRISFAIAVFVSKLRQPYMIIDGERQKLVRKYGKIDPKTNTVSVNYDSENAGDFAKEFGELLIKEWPDDFILEKVKLPDKVFATCEKCSHITEVPFLIDANSLLPLKDKFIE